MTDILDTLNTAQKAAVTAPDGPVLVVAGAGSGKTRVLTTRVAWLMARTASTQPDPGLHLHQQGRQGDAERVAATLAARDVPFWIGTFHATGLRILRADGAAHRRPDPAFSIFDTDDSKRLLKQVLADLNIDAKQFAPNATRAVISKWKNDDLDPAQGQALARQLRRTSGTPKIYEGYQKALVKCNALDFDDLILRTVHLLEQVEPGAAKYAQKFRHVLVDEFQDTNPLQLVLVKLLSLRARQPVRGGGRRPVHLLAGAAPASRTCSTSTSTSRRRHLPAGAELPQHRQHPGRGQRGHRPQQAAQGQEPVDQRRPGRQADRGGVLRRRGRGRAAGGHRPGRDGRG